MADTGGIPPGPFRGMVFGPFAGGSSNARVPGLHEMAVDFGAPAHVHALEVGRITGQCQLTQEQIVPLKQGQLLPLGTGGVIEVLHTPGHSGGSICLCVRAATAAAATTSAIAAGAVLRTSDASPQALIVGDTIFPGSCGRLDLPDSDTSAMFDSLQQLRELDDGLKVYPGHAYSGMHTTIAAEKSVSQPGLEHKS